MGSVLRIRPWRPGDEAAFARRPDFAAERAAVTWDWSAGAPGPTWTVQRWDGAVAAIGGAADLGDGVFQAWASCAGDIAPREWPHVLWLAARALAELFVRHPVKKLLTYGRRTAGAIHCLHRLGFELVGDAPADTGPFAYVVMRRAADQGGSF